MKKSIVSGMILAAGILFISLIKQDFSIALEVSGIVGIGSLLLAGLIAGVFQERIAPGEGFPVEGKQERETKTRWSMKVVLFGLPSAIAAIVTFIQSG